MSPNPHQMVFQESRSAWTLLKCDTRPQSLVPYPQPKPQAPETSRETSREDTLVWAAWALEVVKF